MEINLPIYPLLTASHSRSASTSEQVVQDVAQLNYLSSPRSKAIASGQRVRNKAFLVIAHPQLFTFYSSKIDQVVQLGQFQKSMLAKTAVAQVEVLTYRTIAKGSGHYPGIPTIGFSH